MHTDPDVVVIGSGLNGLVASCLLAKSGLRVTVLEAHPRRPGGALGTEELTLPGFLHDTGAAFFPMMDSLAYRTLDLTSSIHWLHAPFETCHPALDGSYAAIARDIESAAQNFGSEEDGQALRKLACRHQRMGCTFDDALLGPFPTLRPWMRLKALDLLHLVRSFASSGQGLACRWFRSEAARRVLPSLAMHGDVSPEEPFGAALGYALALKATSTGFPFPMGGARTITNALVTLLERHGGQLLLGAPVRKIRVEGRRVRAVQVEGRLDVPVRHAILADTSWTNLVLELIDAVHWPKRAVAKARRFVQGPGTFKVDWALSGSVPWLCPIAGQSAVVHTGESLEDLQRWSTAVRQGNLAPQPYLVIGQQSLFDRSRAPDSQHTLYAYTRVPSTLPEGWSAAADTFADSIEARIEGLAPGFRGRILHRHITTPSDLQRANANLVGGDIGGGDNSWKNQLVFRPAFPYYRYALPVRGLYLCSSYAHPGPGAHGMCGYNAASRVLAELA